LVWFGLVWFGFGMVWFVRFVRFFRMKRRIMSFIGKVYDTIKFFNFIDCKLINYIN
jgi:hypothetical protein